MKGHKMRYTIKKLRALVDYVNELHVYPEYNNIKGRFAVNCAYGAYRIVNVLPRGGCADVPCMTRGSSRQCAMQLMEWMRSNDGVDLNKYLLISDFFKKQIS